MDPSHTLPRESMRQCLPGVAIVLLEHLAWGPASSSFQGWLSGPS